MSNTEARTSQCMICGRIFFERLVEKCEHCGGRCWNWQADQTHLLHRRGSPTDPKPTPRRQI